MYKKKESFYKKDGHKLYISKLLNEKGPLTAK
jgi:hypothetical protein